MFCHSNPTKITNFKQKLSISIIEIVLHIGVTVYAML